MKVFVLLLLNISLLPPFYVVAQNRVSKVVYFCETHLENGHMFDGVNTLYFNENESLYVHNDVPEKDEYGQNGLVFFYKKGDREGYPVYINRDEGFLFYKTIYGGPKVHFILKEELPQIAWEITDQTKQLDGLFCIKACGEFGGRVYDVWFTPDIPVPLGPYKLGGLPGLILQAKSRDGRVAYEFVSYESSVEEHPAIAPPEFGQYVSREEFEKYIIDKLLKTEALSKSSNSRGTNNDPPENYTIEKGKFKIISEYKARRRSKRD